MTRLVKKSRFEMEISLDDAYSLKSPEDNKRLYAKWAKTYESEFVDKEGYDHPKVIAELFHNVIPEVKSVVDIGTGTGLVGKYLARLRTELAIDGIDISPEMLEEAKRKNVYRNLFERDLSKPISDTAAPYDSLICIGIFTHGHLLPSALQNLIPLVRSGGHFVIGINAKYFETENFRTAFEQLHQAGLITTPFFQEITVYKADSAHHNSLNVVSIFQKS